MSGMDPFGGVTAAEFAETIKRNALAAFGPGLTMKEVGAVGRTDPPMVSHLGDIPWHDAPIPRRWHRCRTQTEGSVDGTAWTERCACGATRRSPGLLGTPGPWRERNSRRRA